MKRIVYYIAICFILISCRSSKPEEYDKVLPDESIAPGQCRIIATVVTIDSTLDTANPSSLCSKAPCNAFIRVDSVAGYGSSFPTVLTPGSMIRVMFMFTLGPITLELSPGNSESFPGLPEGVQFSADLRSQIQMSTDGKNKISLSVYGYNRR